MIPSILSSHLMFTQEPTLLFLVEWVTTSRRCTGPKQRTPSLRYHDAECTDSGSDMPRREVRSHESQLHHAVVECALIENVPSHLWMRSRKAGYSPPGSHSSVLTSAESLRSLRWCQSPALLILQQRVHRPTQSDIELVVSIIERVRSHVSRRIGQRAWARRLRPS